MMSIGLSSPKAWVHPLEVLLWLLHTHREPDHIPSLGHLSNQVQKFLSADPDDHSMVHRLGQTQNLFSSEWNKVSLEMSDSIVSESLHNWMVGSLGVVFSDAATSSQ